MNHENGGYDCPGCAWPDDRKGLHLDICENGIKHVTWEMTRKRVDRDFFAGHTVSELSGWTRLRAGGPGPADRADALRRRERQVRADLVGRTPSRWSAAPPRPGQPESGGLLHVGPAEQRGDVPVPALGPRVRHEQPARLLEHVPRGQRPGAAGGARHRQGDRATSSTGRRPTA